LLSRKGRLAVAVWKISGKKTLSIHGKGAFNYSFGEFVSKHLIFRISGTFLERGVHLDSLEQVFHSVTENFTGKLRHYRYMSIVDKSQINFIIK